jgi:hypothetical protein
MATRKPTDADGNSNPTPDAGAETTADGAVVLPVDATVAGDLDPDRTVLKYVVSDVVHLPGIDCEAVASNPSVEPRPVPAGSMWDDTPICRFCRDRAATPEQGGDA